MASAEVVRGLFRQERAWGDRVALAQQLLHDTRVPQRLPMLWHWATTTALKRHVGPQAERNTPRERDG
jgi:hypothetical protein